MQRFNRHVARARLVIWLLWKQVQRDIQAKKRKLQQDIRALYLLLLHYVRRRNQRSGARDI